MSDNLTALFQHHLRHLQHVFSQVCDLCRVEKVWVHSGSVQHYFLDDSPITFKVNPLFRYVVPISVPECWISLDGQHKPHLYFYQPDDYWHQVEPLPDDFWCTEFEWTVVRKLAEIPHLIAGQHALYLGDNTALATTLGFTHINVQKALNYLHYQRSIKSEFELYCMRQAQLPAVRGHLAARAAFEQGKSEFDINLAYLQASEQRDDSVPYGNIIALNAHAAILHYTNVDRQKPKVRSSFMIDAGASYLGYASDISRTYSAQDDEYATLIATMEQYKLRIIRELQVGYNYLYYHTQMHQLIAELLHEFNFVRATSTDIFEQGITRAFFPHGLGHFLGLQVHDVAGFQQTPRGTHKAPPDIYPSLRCTRNLEENMVLTIEPGFYFIPMLLKPWRESAVRGQFNWDKIEAFLQYGGIRTEDNVIITEHGAENITASAFAQLEEAS
ncbi:Xaa-Pro dipeptidase [Spirabiliibacterium falconis]|uniref:Xaa-Pro dipeptidase n=1 Tax=Spirabiliibacterium falconis TaxID=572023 RepID=UPI001AAC6A46|nr:Xaa-Pro dipeptidase [Spirabiliibacterium falconis]MBE2894357.1 Xaa-Pro dipeptidase [Spirabiliibacterium falconis]